VCGNRTSVWKFQVPLLIWLVWTVPIGAQEELPTPTDEDRRDRPKHLVVLRFSVEMLNSLVNKQIDVQTPVSDVVLGTPISGVARITGMPHVELEPAADRAQFKIVIRGTVHSQTVGRNGPAVVQGRAITNFTATKQIVFEPGRGFYGLPPTVAAQSQVFNDGIRSTRGGLIGRVVQRRAARQIAEQQQEITAIARDRATRRIAAALEWNLTERLARLNKAVEFRSMLAGIGEKAQNIRLACYTTPHYVEIANGSGDRDSPIDLPVMGSVSGLAAPIEVWVHHSVVPEPVGRAISTFFNEPEQSVLVNALAGLPGDFGPEAATAVSNFARENNVAVRNIGDWMVIEIFTQRPSTLVATSTLLR
jgi:hypothetical protein